MARMPYVGLKSAISGIGSERRMSIPVIVHAPPWWRLEKWLGPCVGGRSGLPIIRGAALGFAGHARPSGEASLCPFFHATGGVSKPGVVAMAMGGLAGRGLLLRAPQGAPAMEGKEDKVQGMRILRWHKPPRLTNSRRS